MQSILSCFTCGDKTDQSEKIKLNAKESQSILKISNDFTNSTMQDDSKSNTTMTFYTANSFIKPEQDSIIIQRVKNCQQMGIFDRKKAQMQFVKKYIGQGKLNYLMERQWSQLYTNFLKDPHGSQMRPIDNSILLDKNNNLKIGIFERQHYYLVNEKIWKFVNLLYGGGPSIIRDQYFPTYTMSPSHKFLLPIKGLINPHNLCYMIAVLQSLMSIDKLMYYIKNKYYQDNNRKKYYHEKLYKLIQKYKEGQQHIDIKNFASNFEAKFTFHKQHDASEFWLYLTDLLQEQSRIKKNKIQNQEKENAEQIYSRQMLNDPSIIAQAFIGQIRSQIHCLQCGGESCVYNPFRDICLQIVQNSVEGCLRRHFSKEKLSDLYFCQKCKKKTKASKLMSISKTPNYLVVCLKKFTASGRKIQERVQYDLQLNLKKFCWGHHGDTHYRLQSIIVHKGQKTVKGHYYCYTRRGKKNWYLCNDANIIHLQSAKVLKHDAYILFYERVK